MDGNGAWGSSVARPRSCDEAPRPLMAARSAFRWFFWASCVLAAMLCTEPARADAPMCDARGMSVDAPPPITPIGDARIERAPVPHCRTAAMIRLGHRVQRGIAVVDTTVSIESWVTTAQNAVPPPDTRCVARPTQPRFSTSPGYREGVFRPPRVI